MTLEQINADGLRALARELGPVGMVRFLQQFEQGRGDYTAERWQWLPGDLDVDALSELIRRESGSAENGSPHGPEPFA